MNKFALWLLVGVVAWFAWQAWRRAQRASIERAAREAGRVADEPAERLPEHIVRCARCGVHLPASEAVRDGEAVYCGPAHRDADRAASRTGPG